MLKVKTVRSDEYEFVWTVNKYPALVELVDEIPAGVYIYFDGGWRVARTGKDGYPRQRGRFPSLHSAVFNATKG